MVELSVGLLAVIIVTVYRVGVWVCGGGVYDIYSTRDVKCKMKTINRVCCRCVIGVVDDNDCSGGFFKVWKH